MGALGIVWSRQVREDRIARLEADVATSLRELDDAQDALDAWEASHELEYKVLFARGERAELNALDAEWNELVAERDAARELVAEDERELTAAREARSW